MDTKNENVNKVKTKLTFDEVVIKKIVGISISEVDGILGLSGNLLTDFADKFRDTGDITKGISVEVGTKQVAVDVSVICLYNIDISLIFDQALEKIKESILYMTKLELVEFNMSVDDVMTKENYQQK